jgi:hypothetical protein
LHSALRRSGLDLGGVSHWLRHGVCI